MRVTVAYADENYLYVKPSNPPDDSLLKVQYAHIEEFAPTVKAAWENCRLNLLDVTLEENGVCLPQLIVIEPDYLVEVSSLSECMKPYGAHPLNYVRNKLSPPRMSKYILLGNMANLFLDERVNEKAQHPADCTEAIKKAFRAWPLEFTACEDINEAFFRDARTQFHNIQRVIKEVFPQQQIDKEKAILEPNFICEDLGIHGRLDFLQLHPSDGKQFVIELKAGRAPFPESNYLLTGENHQAQVSLYRMMVERVIGVASSGLQTFVLYSRYASPDAGLRLSELPAEGLREIINIRNLIVANERSIACDDSGRQTRAIIEAISAEALISDKNSHPVFLERYIIPQINHFRDVFNNATGQEAAYFYSLYDFVTKEHYLSKTGYREYGKLKGMASLWLASANEKQLSGDILTRLSILRNLSEAETPAICLSIPPYPEEYQSNFRIGDIVILYERNREDDGVNNKQIFKGVIRALSSNEITLLLRQRQRNPEVFPKESLYAIEHDFPDSSYNAIYRDLYSFFQANNDRKELLLNLRQPTRNTERRLKGRYMSAEIDEIVLKAKQANDYFLLSGPPGTGKTSIALRSMVEEFLQEANCHILLLAYTHRAVDEICAALDAIVPAPPYIRIGTDALHTCCSREALRAKLHELRIVVGTVSSLSGRKDLFELKSFQVAIVDEASQILEPQLLGMLIAKDACGRNAVGKFILIGDHKQLPPIVLQAGTETPAGWRSSFFERLYRRQKENMASPFRSMLHKQGRMHCEIAAFPNEAFYDGQLRCAGNPHQTEGLDYYRTNNPDNPWQRLICSKRLVFIASEKTSEEKRNTNEACIVSRLVENIYALYRRNGLEFLPGSTLGILTPYRNQAGLIKREIHRLGIAALNDVTVDTVERYQGSQRDFIIYSVSVNRPCEMDFVSAGVVVENGTIIDRKLNVALTRARKQLFITGHPALLSTCAVYRALMEHIRSR